LGFDEAGLADALIRRYGTIEGKSLRPTTRYGTMTYRSLMFCVSARAKYALVVDIYSYISRIGCIAKPIANPIATLWGLWERLITRTTKLVSSEFSGAVFGTAYISRPTSIAFNYNVSSTSGKEYNQCQRP